MKTRENVIPSSPAFFQDPPNVSLMGTGRMNLPPLPGSGGLFTIHDASVVGSPSPFQMSMVDTSTPTGPMHPHGGGMGMHVSGIKDLNNYMPVHKIKVDAYPRRLFTVENSVTRETIVVLASTQQISLYMLKIKTDEGTKSEKFEFDKFHDLILKPHDLEAFTISQNCSITLAPLKLLYALSARDGKNALVYHQGESNEVPPCLTLKDFSEENVDSIENLHITSFAHDYPVTHLAIDSEKEYLACVQELGAIVVWDINTKAKLAVFHIPNQGIYVSFHRSEPYQLMVIDFNGWVRFFNIFRQCCFRSINLMQSNVFSADWSLSNSNIFAAGFAESFTVIDTCKVLSSMNKCYEVPELIMNAIKVNPNDERIYATLSRLTGTVQLWRDNFATHIWKHRNAHVNDIAWVHGHPYLLALGHETLYIYESFVS